jgi:hypothetical protein
VTQQEAQSGVSTYLKKRNKEEMIKNLIGWLKFSTLAVSVQFLDNTASSSSRHLRVFL